MKRYIRSNSCKNSYFGDTSFLHYDYDTYNVYDDIDDAKNAVDMIRNRGFCATITKHYGINSVPETYEVIEWSTN